MLERPQSYKEFVKQQTVPSYTGETRGYVIQRFTYESRLTVEQVELDPSMDVSDHSTSLQLPVNMKPARRVQY